MSGPNDTPKSTPEQGGDHPRKTRYIVLTMTAREKENNTEALDELREVLRNSPLGLRVVTQKESPIEAPTTLAGTTPEKNFELEIKIGKDVSVRLDAKDAAAKTSGEQPKATPKKVEQIKNLLRKWLRLNIVTFWAVMQLMAAAMQSTFARKSFDRSIDRARSINKDPRVRLDAKDNVASGTSDFRDKFHQLHMRMRDTVSGPISAASAAIFGITAAFAGLVPVWVAMPVGALLGWVVSDRILIARGK